MGKGQSYSDSEKRQVDRGEVARRLRELAAYNRFRAEEYRAKADVLEAEANEMVADDMREYVDGAELITIEA